MVEPDDPHKQEPPQSKDDNFTKLTNQSDIQANSEIDEDHLDSTLDTESVLRRGKDRPLDKGPRAQPPTLGNSNQVSWDGQSSASIEKIGRYILLDKLGSGTYGVVHRARDEVLGRFVALKLLTRFERESEVDSWLSEARVLASLDHPAIVPVFDIGKTPSGQPYIVSKLVSGGTLGKRVTRQGCTVEEAVRIAIQIADALDYLHRKGVMHRDIKPGNILTTPEGDAILADFGLALDETGYGKGARFVGTPAYMSPEQARSEGHRVDGRSDIYSLGVVFYELLAGTRPFKANNQDDLLDCIRNVEVRPLRQLNASVPRELERICLKALAKKISDRYSTAGDLASDLRSWTTSSAAQSTVSLGTAPVIASEQQDSKSHRSLDLSNVAVVPHGLRPFDSGDSDFFNYLLPGARDRNGVPDCVSFWTNRIASRNPSDTFRVGVLLGPSGSGKSSMIRAGVLPLVKREVSAVYVEAKPELLEANLLSQLRHALPSKLVGNSLRETLTQFRQSSKDRPGKKLVIVIDQFEQWLNHHRDDNTTELHEALRQCDGEHLQAILLVRDDFLLGLSQFMDQLEEYLLQNQNFATVEPFGVLHAKRVLSAFGRAYGVLKEDLTLDQEAFLDEAVNQLASAGRLAPVQLAVLSEMVKDKPWNPATLKSLGGVEGLGVAFLEERLAGITAHPLMRAELPVVRRILTEMLPIDDTVIKPPACLQSTLLDRLDGIASDDLIRRLLNLLDTEVRLITPTSNTSLANSGTGSTIGSTNSDPAYQLTHDYLVPTTRKWLESLEAGTRLGRARQSLREISTAWNAKPTKKRLPTFLEWAAIRWLIPKREWTNSEARMMRAADWRLANISLLATMGLLLIGGIGYLTNREIRATALAERLLDADTGNVASVLQAIEPYHSLVMSRVDTAPARLDNPSAVQRHQLHVALAKFDESPEDAAYVFEALDGIEDRHLVSLIRYLRDRKSLDNDQIIARIRRSLLENNQNFLALCSLLALRDTENGVWSEIAEPVCSSAIAKRSSQIDFWSELLQPAKALLLPILIRMLEESPPSDQATMNNLLQLAEAFAANQPEAIARIAARYPPAMLPSLLGTDTPSIELAVELREQLKLASTQFKFGDIPAAQDTAVQEYLRKVDGHTYDKSAWAAHIPWDSLSDAIDRMKEAGFSPTSVRPFHVKDQHFAAVTWTKNASDFVFESGLTREELQSKFDQLQTQDMLMLDFADYELPREGDAKLERRWLGVWQKEPNSANAQTLTLLNEEIRGGFAPVRACMYIDPETGERNYSLLANRTADSAIETYYSDRMEFATGNAYPGYCLDDLRVITTLDRFERGQNYSNYLERREDAQQANAKVSDQISLAKWSSAIGKSDEALGILQPFIEDDFAKLKKQSDVTARGFMRVLALVYSRLGLASELEKLLNEQFNSSELTKSDKIYPRLCLAVLKKEFGSVTTLLADLENAADESSFAEEYYLRALALIAAVHTPELDSDGAFAKLLARAPQSLAKHGSLQCALLDTDFDPLRQRPKWLQLLDSVKLSRSVARCFSSREDAESQEVICLPLKEHESKAIQLSEQGFVPTCINVNMDPSGNLLVTSVWTRKRRPQEQIVKDSRRIAALALSLAKMGEPDALRDGLTEKWGRSVQTELMLNANSVLPADALVVMLRESSSSAVQNTILGTLINYRFEELSEDYQRYLASRLEEWAHNHPDPALLSQARSALHRWKPEKLHALNHPLTAGDQQWYTTGLGQQMVVVNPPELIQVGKENYKRTWTRIGRRYALSVHEVTGAEFEQFRADARVKAWIEADPSTRNFATADGNMPQTASWLAAQLFCQWLNEREGIREDQWCYKDVWNPEGKMTPVPNYLNLIGYRLPTQAEREWACSAGSTEPWHFGSDENYTDRFEWTMPQSMDRPHPVGTKRPNLFGLFDMGGNLAEWVDNSSTPPYRNDDAFFIEDKGSKATSPAENRVLSGGRYRFSPTSAQSNSSVLELSNYVSLTAGFRIARTVLP